MSSNTLIRVLFISSGNYINGIYPIIKAQGESLIKNGVYVDFYAIKGKGMIGYLRNLPLLLKSVKTKRYDILHAHYSSAAFLATMLFRHKLIVSLMGSDVQVSWFSRCAISFFTRFVWKHTIVKSESMKSKLCSKKSVSVLPNGVDLTKFQGIEQDLVRSEFGFDKAHSHIVFMADPNRKEKNFYLAKEVCDFLSHQGLNLKLHVFFDESHERVVRILSAADVLILTSLWEGSPNVIKEAMAVGLPIVTVDVGDVREIIGDTAGCFICQMDRDVLAEALRKAIGYGRRTTGRDRMLNYYDSDATAEKIIRLYNEVVNGF